MADTRLISVPLNEVRTGDEQVIGSEYNHKGKTYRWVKNQGSTAIVRTAPALMALTSVVDGLLKKVVAADAGATTGLPSLPAGAAMTAIQASGSNTGDHGWIQIAGMKKVSVQHLVTALVIGQRAIASSTYNAAWASVSILTDSTTMIATKRVQLMEAVASTGAATAASAIVEIQCNS